jgi:hypothetical protein
MHLVKFVLFLWLSLLFFSPSSARADNSPSLYENTISETLDLWRDGRYEQLFEQLARRGKISREQFVRKMKDAPVRPACCWQKMEHFKLLSEKKNNATVYVKIGLEGGPGQPDSVTREFQLSNEHGAWKMQMNDIMALAGVSKKKNRNKYHKVVRYH